ncbi:hypothetical protein GEMRC1_007923 [Eukaryota sp. GEM-RC1]
MLCKEPLNALSLTNKSKLLDIYRASDWVKHTEKKGAILYKRPSPHSPIHQVRLEIVVNRPVSDVFSFLADPSNNPLVEPSMEELKEILDFSTNSKRIRLLHVKYQLPVVSNREAVVCVFDSEEDDQYILGSCSLDPSSVNITISHKKHVWCTVHISGHILFQKPMVVLGLLLLET